MAGICSMHREMKDDCKLCNTDIKDLIPNIEQLREEAKKAGTALCSCGFVYYLTADTCPKCGE
jgi:hypothetical protein